jgi:hypothetical protein
MGRLTLGTLACVLLLGVVLSLAAYILFGLPVVRSLAGDTTPTQSIAVGAPALDTIEHDDYEVVTIPSPVQAVGPTEQPFLEATPLPSPEQEQVCQEDEPCWDCRFDGNERCGVEIEGVWYIIQFRDGSPESVSYR